MPLTPSRLLKTAFGFGLFVILCIGGFTFKHIKSLSETSKGVKETYTLKSELDQIISNLKDAQTGHRGFLLTHDSLFLSPYNKNLQKIANNLKRLDSLILDNKEQRENLKQLEIDIAQRFETFNKSLAVATDEAILSKDLLFLLHEGEIRMERIRNDVSSMLALENELLIRNQKKNEKALGLTPLFFYGLLILTLVLLLMTYLKMNSDLKVLKENNEDLEVFKKLTKQAEIVSNSGTWIWYVENNKFDYSDNLFRLLGEEPNAFEAGLENFFMRVHEDDRQSLGQVFDKMMIDEDLPFVTFRVVHPNGDIRHLKSYGKLLNTHSGEKQLLGVTLDVTEEIHNFKLIEERNNELERNNKELSAFNYVASHDLQEPLRKIQTFISRLEVKEKDQLSEYGSLYISRIKSASARMRMLIEDLLQYSRTSKSDAAFTKTNMNMLLEHAQEEIADSIESKNAEITSDDLPTMEVISFQIQQLFINLISNSLKYSKEGVPPIIKITHQEIRSNDVEELKKSLFKYYHKISFIDNGIGFEQTYAENIFVLFNRLHGKSEYWGTGIGLAICKKIVENHRGVILAEGKPNLGATFTIYLPFLK